MDHSHRALAVREREQDDSLSLAAVDGGKFWVPTDKQAQIIADIVKHCREEGITAQELAAATMNDQTKKARHATSWTKIVRGNLEAGDRTPLFEDFVKAFKLVYRRRELIKRGATAYVKTEAYELLRKLVANAEARQGIGSAERLVVAVGDSGKGKTAACQQVITEHGNGVLIHGSEVWKCSYKAVLADVCDAVGVSTRRNGRKGKEGREKTAPELRRELLAELKTNRRTLFFEEIDQECLTPALVKLWMALLNSTLATVVLAINPDALDAVQRMGLRGSPGRAVDPDRLADIAAQLLRRGRQVPFADVELIVPQTLLERTQGKVKGIDAAAAALVEAGALGGYSLVCEVVQALAGQALSLDAVDAAVESYLSRFKPGSMSRAVVSRPVAVARKAAA